MEGYYTICMKVNQDMEDTIKGIFANCGWDYDQLVTRPHQVESLVEESVTEESVSEVDQVPDQLNNMAIPSSADDQCPHCFLAPCVTQRPNNFLGNGQVACVENSGMRKTFYRGYWKAINYLGGWKLPAYLAKKQTAGHGEWILRHRREILPYCVLKQVRDLYPNPHGKPYMGHKWE